MINKTFKSALDSPVTLEVERETHPAGVYLTIGQSTILLAASDAPALCLAILEAAGVTETDSPYMHEAADNLRAYILIEETVAAEAKERAELEAEALELRNEYFDRECSWSDINNVGQTLWLRMARKAREIGGRAEK